MGEFLKKFGQGLLYILILPVFLVALAAYAVYGVILFIVVSIITIVNFFRGRPFNSDLPEDIEAKKRLGYLTNPFEEIEKQEKQEPIYVMESGEPEHKVIDEPQEYHQIEDVPQNTIEHHDIPAIEEQEEVSIPETNFEEEEPKQNQEEEILPMDDMEDDHIFSDDKDWWNK